MSPTHKIERFGEILKTTDYNLFSKLKGNRKPNEAHIQNLMHSLQEKQLVVPIIVNENMEIIDGQHRYEACRRLGLSVYYIGIEGYNLHDCHILNANNVTYKPVDFLNGYIELGFPEYIRFQDFRKKFPFLSIQMCMIYLAGGKIQKDLLQFKEGSYKVKTWELANLWAERTFDFQKFNLKFLTSRNFNLALIKMYKHPQYDHARMLNKLEYQSGELRAQAKEKYYIEMLCNIYNFNSRSEFKISPWEVSNIK